MTTKYNPAIHHRRSIRLRGYAYAQAGAYFVTICTHKKECVLGEIANDEIQLNPYGNSRYALRLSFRADSYAALGAAGWRGISVS